VQNPMFVGSLETRKAINASPGLRREDQATSIAGSPVGENVMTRL